MRSLVAAVFALLVAAAPADAATWSVSFQADGTFRVPQGVTRLAVVAIGGHGEAGGRGATGGRGAEVTGSLAATPGATLTLRIGHGGAGGASGVPTEAGGAGGGMAAVLDGSDYRVAAAGGGGGGGVLVTSGHGGDAGANGADGTGSGGGRAGTAAGPGAGGSGDFGGSPGAIGTGGAGASGSAHGGGGGGGGASAFGGGGGGARQGPGGGGGGGGGYSLVDTSVVSGASTTLVDGNGPASVTFVYDDPVAPAITLAAPGDNPAVLTGTAGADAGDSPTVMLDVFAGPAATGTPAFSLSAPVAAGGTFSLPAPRLADGTWTVRARQSDAAGNSGTSPARTFAVETSKPAVTLTAPGPFVPDARPHFAGAAGTAGGDLPTITVAVYQGATATGAPVALAPAIAVNGAFAVDLGQNLPDGTFTAVARQDDSFGNHGASAPRTFAVDTVAPAPTLADLPALTGADVPLEGTAGTAAGDDDHVVLDVTRDGVVVRTVSAPIDRGAYLLSAGALADGAYTVTATQGDAAGHRVTTAPRSFRVDTTPPEIASSLFPAYALGQVAAAVFSCTDAGAGVATCDGPAAVDTATAGDHVLTIAARDRAGNTRTLHVPYIVLAPAALPAAGPAPATLPAANSTPATSPAAKPAVAIASAKLKRHRRTLTLTLRGTAIGTSPVKLTVTGVKGSGRTKTAPVAHGTWRATMRIRVRGTLPRRLTLTANEAGVSAHRALRVR